MNDLEQHLRSVEPGQLLLGLGSNNHPYSINLDVDVPHILLSIPSGGGKSVAVALLGCQILHQGGELVVIDLDMATNWIKDGDQLIPGVTYCRTVEEAHAKLIQLGELQKIRNATADADPNYAPHRHLTVVEEANRTGEELGAHWVDLNQKGNSPALRALRGLTQGGRKRRMGVLAVPQRADAFIFGPTGGGAAIENFPLRIFGSEASERTWENNAPQIKLRPPITRHKGRVHVVEGNTYTTVQVGYLTDQQARHWATNGIPPADAEATEAELPGWLQ
jgi:hypothetical protein